MSRGWKALEEEVVDGWMCRFSDGVTRRANSVLPLGEPAGIAAAIAVIERFYAARGLPAVFQISADSLPRDLDDVLAKRGYAADSPTVVQLLGKESLAVFAGVPADRRVVLSDRPSPEWLQVHWDVEGPQESAKQEANRKILENTPSVYAALVVGERIESVARMALVADLGGIYCVATRPESRSRGYARTVVGALLAEAARRLLEGVWLQVVESNTTAGRLYASLGFETVSRYHYRSKALHGQAA